MKKEFRALRQVTKAFACSCLLMGCTSAFAAETLPDGVYTTELLGSTDNLLCLPYQRPSVYCGVASDVQGNVITVSGTTNWNVNQFAYADQTQTDTYCVQFNSGSLDGMTFTINANGSNTLAVESEGSDIAGAFSTGDSFCIFPYWTFGTLFPEGAGVKPSSSHIVRPSEVHIPNMESPGINLSAGSVYYYFSGSTTGGPGWRRVGAGLTNIVDDDVIRSDAYFIVRHKTEGNTRLNIVGSVPVSRVMTPISRLASMIDQDNALGFPFPDTYTLTESQLFESGAFEGSQSHLFRADQLYFYDRAAMGINQSPNRIFYYYTGTANGGPGWREVGGGLSNIKNGEPMFKPGTGFFVRKKGSTELATVYWSPPNPSTFPKE